MGLLFRQNVSEALFGNTVVDTGNWLEVFSACLGRSAAFRAACEKHVIKGRAGEPDFRQGIISFGGDEYQMKLLGNESKTTGTWIWAWEQPEGFGDDLLSLARRTRALGKKWRLEPLTVPKAALSRTVNGCTLATVACAADGRSLCWHRLPHSEGATYVAFICSNKKALAPVGAEAFKSIAIQCLRRDQADHGIFVRCFLHQNGTPFETLKSGILAHFDRDVLISTDISAGTERVTRIEVRS